MTEERQDAQSNQVQLVDIKRRGFPVYTQNPTVKGVQLRKREQSYRVERGNQLMLVNQSTGEVVGQGVASFLKTEVVDPEQFMKVYLGSLDKFFTLKQAGQTVFKILWKQIQANKDSDKVELVPAIAAAYGFKITERTFQRGVRELLDKEFLFMSMIDGIYFINVGVAFNGNRINVVTQYVLEGTQESLPLPDPPHKLEAPNEQPNGDSNNIGR